MSVKTITLRHGQVVLLDDEDYEWLIKFRWHYATNGYIKMKDTRILMHRFIMGVQDNPNAYVDHINHNPSDNRRSNLRLCTQKQNAANKSPRKNSTSKYLGVCKIKGWWVAQIRMNGATKCLGRFMDESDAAKAYDTAAKELYGEFANLNFV